MNNPGERGGLLWSDKTKCHRSKATCDISCGTQKVIVSEKAAAFGDDVLYGFGYRALLAALYLNINFRRFHIFSV